MDAPAIINALSSLVTDAVYEPGTSLDCPTFYVPAARLVATCAALRDNPVMHHLVDDIRAV